MGLENRQMEINKNFSDKAIEDYNLVLAALSGKQSAYTSIMVRYREPIYYLVLKMVRNEGDAEDLAIEAFEKAFKKLEQYSPEYAFSTWLFRIATNHCIDHIRKKKIQTTSIDDFSKHEKSWGIQVKTKTKDPEEAFIEKQKIKMMREVVSNLDEPYKTLVEMRYFKELSYEEIAKERNIPLGTVKAQLFRSRAILADIIRKSKDSI